MPGKEYLYKVPYPLHTHLQGLELNPKEAFLLSQMDGVQTGEDLIKIVPLSQEETQEILHSLTQRGLIEWRDQARKKPFPKGSGAQIQPDHKPAPSPSTSEDPQLKALIKKVELYRKLLETGDPFRVFGIKPGTSDEEVRERFLQISRHFHPDRYYHLDLPRDLKNTLEEIYNTLREFYSKVSSEEKRREWFLKAKGVKKPEERKSHKVLDKPRLEKLLAEALSMGQYDNALRLLDLMLQMDPFYPVDEKRRKIQNLRRVEELLQSFLGENPITDLERIEKMLKALLQLGEELSSVPRLLYSATMFLYLYTEDVPRMQSWIETLLREEQKPEYYLLAARIMVKGELYERAYEYLEKIPRTSSYFEEARRLIKELRSR